jgi:hypothetical protein
LGPGSPLVGTAELTDEQNEMREMALEFAQIKLAPFAEEWDAKKTLHMETVKEAAALGIGGVTVGRIGT